VGEDPIHYDWGLHICRGRFPGRPRPGSTGRIWVGYVTSSSIDHIYTLTYSLRTLTSKWSSLKQGTLWLSIWFICLCYDSVVEVDMLLYSYIVLIGIMMRFPECVGNVTWWGCRWNQQTSLDFRLSQGLDLYFILSTWFICIYIWWWLVWISCIWIIDTIFGSGCIHGDAF